ncbi:MAG: hypothetical protein KDD50_09245 [Bdellovibrionales bacterium]|nr:hypothetical protein [Bdellovibrionales bacterium]
MWQRRQIGQPNRPSFYNSKTTLFIDKDFQVKYIFFVVGATFVGMALLLTPIWIYTQQNFEIFENLAYLYSPNLVEHINREAQQINLIIIATFLGVLCFFTFISMKLTSQIVGPIKVIKNHLKFLSRGIWSQRPVKVRENDEFQDLVDSYNYFYQSFRHQIKKDIDLLNEIQVNLSDRESYRAWKSLITEKQAQLNLAYKTERMGDQSCPVIKIHEQELKKDKENQAS